MATSPVKPNPLTTKTVIYTPPATSLTPDPEDIPKNNSEMGSPPAAHMTTVDSVDHMMTDITHDEMAAGKRAADQYSQRRQAELDYGKRFAERRIARTQEK
jgi:hypothetical protein